MVVLQKTFKIVKPAQITWSFIGHDGQPKLKILWATIFQKVTRPPSHTENPPPKKSRHTHTHKIIRTKEGNVVRLELMPSQCKDRHHTDKLDVLTTTLQWINTKNF